MARTFSAAEAKRYLREAQDILSGLETALNQLELFRKSVESSADKLCLKEALRLLNEVPIEELNRTRQGFRTKLLRENGYETVGDIVGAAAGDIAAIHGIGEDSAYAITVMVRGLVDDTVKNVRLRLSADDKNPEASELVLALSRLARALPLEEMLAALLKSKGPIIREAIKNLMPATGSLRWIFSSGEKKRRAQAAYDTLKALSGSPYANKAKELARQFVGITAMTAGEAWQNFGQNPIKIFNTLETVSPGRLESGDGLYGLPEEMAKGIAEESFKPEGLNCSLRRYQEWGVKYILHQKRVLLGDEMGLGKTVQAIAAMVSLKNTGASHFIVVCPASVLSNWCREIKKHSVLQVTKIHGADRSGAFASWLSSGGVAVTTYETTAFISLPEGFKLSMLVVDEAHYIKNPYAQRTAHVKKLCAQAERILFMTGTALENRVDEMIALMDILKPELAKSVKNISYLSAAQQFREKIAPVYYRRKREDVLTELPELIESREWCTMGREEAEIYEDAVLARNFAAARRVSWNVKDLSKSSKGQRLKELVEEAEGDGRKIIVFSFFLDTVKAVCTLLGSRCTSPITGAVPPAKRQEIIDGFDKAPAGSVLVAQIQSGGTGLNIQSASVVILCEPQFKPSIENQAISRAYRMGQSRNVLVYRLLCDDTVDERIIDILTEKQQIFDAFADDSAAASLEIDERGFGGIIEEEIRRIQRKNGEE